MIFSINFRISKSETDSNSQMTQNTFHSKITPFNITTLTYWTPYMIDTNAGFKYDLSNTNFNSPMAVNGSFGPLMGKKLSIYSSLFPLYPNTSILHYSINILNLLGPSNISLYFQVQFVANSISYDIVNKVIINSSVNNSTSGIINVIPPNFLSYDKILSNLSTNWIFSSIYLQPKSNNNQIPWNHTLIVQVSLFGQEDRVFFNYLRTQKGYPAWTNNQFTALTIPNSILSNTSSENFYLQSNSQPYPIKISNLELVYLNNKSNFGNKTLQFKINMTTNQNLNMEFFFSRIVITYGYSIYKIPYSYYLKIPLKKGENEMILQIPWEKMNKINSTVTLFNSTELILSSGQIFFSQNFTRYEIVNSVYLDYQSLQSVWNASVTTNIQANLLNNLKLQDNTINLTLNEKTYIHSYEPGGSYDLVSYLSEKSVLFHNNLVTVLITGLIVIFVSLVVILYLSVEYRKFRKIKLTSSHHQSFKRFLKRKSKKEQELIKTESADNLINILEEIIDENQE